MRKRRRKSLPPVRRSVLRCAPAPHRIQDVPPHMRIATWNVNSIKQRMDNALAWLTECRPDVVCLQETKCVDDAFPRLEFESLGYNVAVHGQKTFNGVAILSRLSFDQVIPRLPGSDEDDHDRF